MLVVVIFALYFIFYGWATLHFLGVGLILIVANIGILSFKPWARQLHLRFGWLVWLVALPIQIYFIAGEYGRYRSAMEAVDSLKTVSFVDFVFQLWSGHMSTEGGMLYYLGIPISLISLIIYVCSVIYLARPKVKEQFK